MDTKVMTVETDLDPIEVIVRPGEVALKATMLFGADGSPHRCGNCGKQVARVRCAWDHRITNGRPGEWKLGEDWFETYRHIDGTPCGVDSFDGKPRCYVHSLQANYLCPECGGKNCHTVKQLAYGDETTCTTPGCTYRSYYSIGD